MRELKTRFGSTKYGYFWMLVEPIFHILILSFIFSSLGRAISLHISFSMFLLIGLLPYFLFNNIINRTMDSITANRGLMSYHPVKIIDPMIARLLLEIMIFILTFVIVSIVFIYFGIFSYPKNILFFTFLLFMLIIFSFSIGIIFAIIKEYYQDFNKIASIILKPLYYISGIFYTAKMIPPNYREMALYNPLLNYLEALRGAWFLELKDTYVNYEYIFLLTIILLALSLLLYSTNQNIFKVIK